MLSPAEVEKVLGPLSDVFTNWKPTPGTFRAYRFILGDLPLEALKVAVWRALAAPGQFPPSPGDLRALALDALEQASGSAVPTGYEAWERISRAITDVGHLGSPDLDPLAAQAIRQIGGWRSVCLSESPESQRARFLEAYRSLQSREVEMRRLPPAVQHEYSRLAARLAAPKRPALPTGGSS